MLAASKADARKKFIRERSRMAEKEVEDLSKKINSTIMKLPQYERAETIMLYLSFNNEINSLPLIEDCFKRGKKVVVPYCKKEGIEIIPTELNDMSLELRRTKFGYLETKKEFVKPVPYENIDLIVVPGLAFDSQCHRLGFGAGYYDRFLSKIDEDILTIGIAYDFQILELIPEKENTDIPLDYVITEKRIIVK